MFKSPQTHKHPSHEGAALRRTYTHIHSSHNIWEAHTVKPLIYAKYAEVLLGIFLKLCNLSNVYICHMTPTRVNNYAAFSINPSMVISLRIYNRMQLSGHSLLTSAMYPCATEHLDRHFMVPSLCPVRTCCSIFRPCTHAK